MSQVQEGPARRPGKVAADHECSRCGQSMVQADRGFGSTGWACPAHGFDRQVVTVYVDGSVDFPHLRTVRRDTA